MGILLTIWQPKCNNILNILSKNRYAHRIKDMAKHLRMSEKHKCLKLIMWLFINEWYSNSIEAEISKTV